MRLIHISQNIWGVKFGDTWECWLNSTELMTLICSVMDRNTASMWPGQTSTTVTCFNVHSCPSMSRDCSGHGVTSSQAEVKSLCGMSWSSLIMVWAEVCYHGVNGGWAMRASWLQREGWGASVWAACWRLNVTELASFLWMTKADMFNRFRQKSDHSLVIQNK